MSSSREPSPSASALEVAKSHTPAPWTFTNGELPRVITRDGKSICGVHKIGRFSGQVSPEVAFNGRLIANAPHLLSDGWTLAVMALQSERYAKDGDFRDAVDAMLDTCRIARGEQTRDQYLASKAEGK